MWMERQSGKLGAMSERRILLVRHAKADRPEGVGDVDRPLTARGHADAGAIGAWLAHRDYRPDLVICSPSKRTRQTWHGIALGLADAAGEQAPAPEVDYRDEVYDGEGTDLIDLIQGVDDVVNTVMIIGHNPSVSEASELFDPASAGDLRTSGVAAHAYAGEWDECGPGTAPLLETHTARG
ncbi:phosphoglycerate mutase [Asanoa ishikariensis]|uniref:Phosphohistidine phosphatase n=2 Tax=Asanoa ishikariensis TaxID=137265 RepID=A0A1H3UWX4_9ACTN|nr:phosphoglycerate mutase [Asanoa ishikariensis]SDZ66786.1 phosphohistidine phosphatase [Asanoa ishikariensis]